MTADAVREIVDLDLTLLDTALRGEGRMTTEGGSVEFSVKELLVDIRGAIDQLGRSTKQDLADAERRIHDRIVIVESAAKDRAEAIETAAQASAAAQDQRLAKLENWQNRAAGAVALATFIGAGVGAAVVTVIR